MLLYICKQLKHSKQSLHKVNSYLTYVKYTKQQSVKIMQNSNLYSNYVTTLVHNVNYMCTNNKCKHYKQCANYKMYLCYKHLCTHKNNYVNSITHFIKQAINYICFYSYCNYKYANNYKVQQNVNLLISKIQVKSCSTQ